MNTSSIGTSVVFGGWDTGEIVEKHPEEHVLFISNHLLKGSQAELFSTCGVSISAMSVINGGPSKGVEIPKKSVACQDSFEG